MTATFPSSIPAHVSELAEEAPKLDGLKISDIVRTLPKACFKRDWRRATLSILTTVLSVGVGYWAIAVSPWFLLPIAWFFTGTAATGLFVIGHDCGHRSFAKQRWVNDWVGHIMMMPLIYPFHSWRLLHDHHHIHTNKLEEDNAWAPWTVESFSAASPLLKFFYRAMRGPFWWLASIVHWAGIHFSPANFAPRDRQSVKLSIAVVGVFAALFFPTLYFTLGLWGIVKFWLMPWLGYHFWMSTFTLVHHTIPEIQFRSESNWAAVPAQLAGTVHCTYPKWIEVLCHDINVHVPHHISVAIPSYNLRLAHASLVENWGDYIHNRQFDWKLMSDITARCHLYDEQEAYRPFHHLR